MTDIHKRYCGICRTTNNLMHGYWTKGQPRKSDGVVTYRYICNPCNTARLKAYRATKRGRERTYRARDEYIKRSKDKQLARWQVQNAVAAGKILKPKGCDACGQVKPLDGHHSDYTKPLEVDWLCRDCHALAHRKLETV